MYFCWQLTALKDLLMPWRSCSPRFLFVFKDEKSLLNQNFDTEETLTVSSDSRDSSHSKQWIINASSIINMSLNWILLISQVGTQRKGSIYSWRSRRSETLHFPGVGSVRFSLILNTWSRIFSVFLTHWTSSLLKSWGCKSLCEPWAGSNVSPEDLWSLIKTFIQHRFRLRLFLEPFPTKLFHSLLFASLNESTGAAVQGRLAVSVTRWNHLLDKHLEQQLSHIKMWISAVWVYFGSWLEQSLKINDWLSDDISSFLISVYSWKIHVLQCMVVHWRDGLGCLKGGWIRNLMAVSAESISSQCSCGRMWSVV